MVVDNVDELSFVGEIPPIQALGAGHKKWLKKDSRVTNSTSLVELQVRQTNSHHPCAAVLGVVIKRKF
jgi:hypothetical protein